MNRPIAIFYHCLFVLGDPPQILQSAMHVVHEQMTQLKQSGLEDAATEIYVGVNGGKESEDFASAWLPQKANITYHGLDSRNENSTLVMIEDWLPGHEDWNVLYFHAKGSTHPINDALRSPWRNCMTRHVIINWKTCISALEEGYEASGCHWMTPPATPPTQYIFAGNFWWAKASFLRQLPPMNHRERIKTSGIKAFESRYESEVWIGNGPRPPVVKDFHPFWDPGKIGTCSA